METAIVWPSLGSGHCETSSKFVDNSSGGAGGVEGVNNLISAITASAWLLSPCSQPDTKTDLNLQHLVAALLLASAPLHASAYLL